MASLDATLAEAFESFRGQIAAALPDLIAGALFLVLAFLTISVVTRAVRFALERLYPPDERLVADFGVIVVTVALWFAAGLVLLTILGMGQVAASLGTAAGFLALGVSYALSDMIADTVAGLYLLRDPDFNAGDTVTTADVTGEVLSIGLRKSRLVLEDGDVIVLANQAVEQRWRRDT